MEKQKTLREKIYELQEKKDLKTIVELLNANSRLPRRAYLLDVELKQEVLCPYSVNMDYMPKKGDVFDVIKTFNNMKHGETLEEVPKGCYMSDKVAIHIDADYNEIKIFEREKVRGWYCLFLKEKKCTTTISIIQLVYKIRRHQTTFSNSGLPQEPLTLIY